MSVWALINFALGFANAVCATKDGNWHSALGWAAFTVTMLGVLLSE